MSKLIPLKETLSIVEKVYSLTECRYKEQPCNRFLALCELARKIRTCLNAVYLLPYEKYDVLCTPVNLMYRCMITDLMTSLFFSVIDDETLEVVIHRMDIDFVNSYKKALEANIDARKHVYPEERKEWDELKRDYQEKLYKDLKDCLKSTEIEDWEVMPKTKIIINKVEFKNTIDTMYNVLKTFDETCALAGVYNYYKLFSQSEHFSIKGRFINYKQSFHEQYYNKIHGFIYLGYSNIYDKYKYSINHE